MFFFTPVTFLFKDIPQWEKTDKKQHLYITRRKAFLFFTNVSHFFNWLFLVQVLQSAKNWIFTLVFFRPADAYTYHLAQE